MPLQNATNLHPPVYLSATARRRGDRVNRREFITLLGGVAAAWPLAARAQQTERVRRVGVLMSVAADGPDGQPRLAAFLKRLQELGWTDGQNVRIDVRWGAGEAERSQIRGELVALGPDVILASGDHPVVALQQATSTVPIIFAMVADPVGAGFVESLAHPGRNTTGFTLYEYSTTAKWPELLKEIAPGENEWRSFGKPAQPPEPASSPGCKPECLDWAWS
jgi:ABC-type uncharacterized transport system substrate-binding protein